MYNMKTNYYLSGKDNIIYIIDEESLNIIEKVEVEQRLQDIVFYSNKVYVASDRSNVINIIENNKIVDKLYITNNGKININLKNKEIYICNTDRIDIYNLNIEIIETIKGFRAAYKIEFNEDFSKIYILDILSNEIKVYDIDTKKLVKVYKDIGETPIDFFVLENKNLIYILNKGIDGIKFLGEVVVINIFTEEIIKIEFPKGSLFKNMDLNDEYICISNYGLNRIDIININNLKAYGNIKATLDIPIYAKIDGENLIVISEDNLQGCVLDIIKIDRMKIEKSLNLYEKNIKAKKIDILMGKKELQSINNKEIKQKKYINSNEIINDKIIIKRVFSEFKEEIVFNKVKMEIKNIKIIESVEFERWEIIKENTFKNASNEEKYADIRFEFKIPYNIIGFTENNEKVYIKGSILKSENIKVFLDNYKIEEIDFSIKSNTNMLAEPIISESYMYADIISVIAVYTVIEEYLSLNSYISLLEKSN